MSNIASLPEGVWKIDEAHSSIGFEIRHLTISKVRGTFGKFEGTVTIGDLPSDSKVEGQAEVASIDTRNSQRDEHLRSDDFFAASKFPQITFTSTSITEDGNKLSVTGDFAMHGETKPVTFEVEVTGVLSDNGYGQTVAGFEAHTTISRKDFGLTWNAALEAGGMTLGDGVKINIEGEMALQQ